MFLFFLLETWLFYHHTTAHSPEVDPGHLCSFKAPTLILQTWPFTRLLGGRGSQTQLCIRITREEPANMRANMCYSWIPFLIFKFSGSAVEPRNLYFYKIHPPPDHHDSVGGDLGHLVSSQICRHFKVECQSQTSEK